MNSLSPFALAKMYIAKKTVYTALKAYILDIEFSILTSNYSLTC